MTQKFRLVIIYRQHGTQDVETPEPDDDEPEPEPVAVMSTTHDQAMSHALKLKGYMLHYSNMYGMDVCSQIDEVCRKINIQTLQNKKQVDITTAWSRM